MWWRGAGMVLSRWKRAAVALLLLWAGVSYLVIAPLSRCQPSGEESERLEASLRAATDQLEALRSQHNTLLAQIRASRLSGNIAALDNLGDVDVGPSEEYETLRRKVYSNTEELWRYISHELATAIKDGTHPDRLTEVLEQIEDRKSVLLADQQRLWAADGQAGWRAAEAANVSALVQRRLHRLQHPPDCAAARKILCNLNKGCGFGCQVHHIAYCLIFAYASERTLVLSSKGWRYNAKGWDQVFRPLSDTCTTYPTEDVRAWPAVDARVVSLPFIDSMTSRPKFLPLAVPKDLGQRVVRFNGDPGSWWVGQMLRYILRPRDHLAATINQTIHRIHYRTPIVGVHIRRTDKVGTEAAFHHIDEYMKHVRQYWAQRDLYTNTRTPRRVYLASDDPAEKCMKVLTVNSRNEFYGFSLYENDTKVTIIAVLEDARKKYSDVEFVGDPSIARTAATHRRYTPASLAGLLVDLALLARADFLVCTFSSQVGRVAYELMQANRADASQSVQSLDDIYYFGGQNPHNRVAILPHRPRPTEIALQEGDLVGVAGNHWNGYGRGLNRRTNQNGLFPWYKTADYLVLHPFPTYPHVPRRGGRGGRGGQGGEGDRDRERGVDLANFIPRTAQQP